jgi:hypothetical protein
VPGSTPSNGTSGRLTADERSSVSQRKPIAAADPTAALLRAAGPAVAGDHHTVVGNRAAGRRVKSDDQARHRRFSAARLADQPQRPARKNIQRITADIPADKALTVIELQGIPDAPVGRPVRAAGTEGQSACRGPGECGIPGLSFIIRIRGGRGDLENPAQRSGHGREKGLLALEELSTTKTLVHWHG